MVDTFSTLNAQGVALNEIRVSAVEEDIIW